MATFIVEDGTGKTNANAYVTEAEADAYVDDHSQDAVWVAPLSSALKQKAIRLATQYLDATYDWFGVPTNEDQALDWPREGVPKNDRWEYDSDEMPQALKDACAELAVKSANGTDLLADLTDNGTIKREKSKVGSLESEIEYVDGNSPNTSFQLVDDLLSAAGLAEGSDSAVIDLERA
jgi:hypothetical protein